MKNDSISASTKIKELFELHRSGILSIEDYHSQLRSWIISQLRMDASEVSGTGKKPVKGSGKYMQPISQGLNMNNYDLLRSDQIDKIDDQPVTEKVEKILWTLLN